MSDHTRCGSCGKVLLNYPMVSGVVYERAHFSCTVCAAISQRMSDAAAAMARQRPGTVMGWGGAETYGNHRDEWEDMKSGARGGIGWVEPGKAPDA
jgi:hypothetical protein